MDVLDRSGSAGINGERINGLFHLLINDKVVVSNIFFIFTATWGNDPI